MSSNYSKSVYSGRSHRDSVPESWGTVQSGSRTPTPSHTSTTFAHRSNPSYPSPHYGFTGLAPYAETPGTPFVGTVPLPYQYCGTPAPFAPYMSTIPLPDDVSMNPLLRYPPKATFNVTYHHSSIAFRDNLSSNDVAIYPAVHSLTLGLSFICAGKTVDVRASTPHGLTVRDVFVTLSSFLLSVPTSHELSTLRPDILARGKATQHARRTRNETQGLRWADFLGDCVYFGGLVKNMNGVHEVHFVSAPLA
ncbi:hypothetical protein BDP27DRAFT_1034558 [Rhodocollybia butyracea]|uniref:DUF6699 domain-containing protein n=1 Tax=Rhodocollybia butyracea TaxID=206335 RepID=A0A9P5Q6D7_9AGAR|nr:hypothetical protein BDP27DRAFT_1034558 [Rhodocollybia butyracea]